MEKRVLKWELSGVVFVFLLGALLHFLFEWSGESGFVGVFASVNESVWEHFKQGFWPICLYAAIEYGFLRGRVNNFLVAKAVAVYVIPIVTGLMFYAYTAVTGEEILIVDIAVFFIAIVVGQLISYKILVSSGLPGYASYAAAAFIVILASVLVLTTFYPLQLPIFLDANTGGYGIP